MAKKSKLSEHKNRILNFIYGQQPVSRLQIGEETGIRLATITEAVRQLMDEGLVVETGTVSTPGRRGRNQTLLEINPEGQYFLGCELAPGMISTALLDLTDAIVATKEVRFAPGGDKFDILDEVGDVVSSLVEEQGIAREKIAGVGFVDPGVVDRESGISLVSTILPGWEDVPTRDYLSKKLNLPVFLIGTSQAKALAEQLFGKGKGRSDFIFIEYGEGIACGIVSGGRLLRGKMEVAGELGHYRFSGRREVCHCGGRGCLEVLASLPAIEESARSKIREGADSMLEEMSEGRLDSLSYHAVISAAEKGDALALGVLQEAANYMSVAVGNVVNLLDPELVILDRNFSLFSAVFRSDLMDTIRDNVIFSRDLEFEISDIGEYQGSIGGAGIVFRNFFF